MGAATSVAAVGPPENAPPRPNAGPAHTSAKTAELDKYGGTNRPAVKRGESFNKAMGWLGETVATQAEQLQDALVHPVTSEDAVESIHIAPQDASRRTVNPGGSAANAGTSRAGGSSDKKRVANRGGSEAPSGARGTGKAPVVKEMPMSDTLAKAVKGHRGWQAKVSNGSNNGRKGRPTAGAVTAPPTAGGGGRSRPGKGGGTVMKGGAGVMKSGGGLQGIFSSAGRSNRTQGSRKDRKGGWRHRVHNAKKTAYMTLKVYLKMNAAWKNQLPEALRTDIAQVVRATLHDDFPKFATHNERFFRSPSQFSHYEQNNLGRAASIRVVDLDQDLASSRRRSSGSAAGGEISLPGGEGSLGAEGQASMDDGEVGDQDAAMMEMYARKANAAWVERRQWEAPKVFEMHTYTLSVERTHYNYVAKELLKKGKIAFHFVATGEAVYTPDGRALNAVTTDTWHLLTSCAPSKVPCGSRIEGLPPVSRQIIQLIECIERVAGVDAVENLQIVISVGEDEEDLVINLLKEHKFYRLGPKQVHVLVQDKQFGYKYESKYGELMEAEESELVLPGSGHALLQLAAPGDALTWDGGHMTPHDGSLLDHFKARGVVWLMSCRMLDLYWCTSHRQTDLDFLGLCLKLHDTSKANMAVEVAPCRSLADMRLNNSVVMEHTPGKGQPSTTCDVAYTDCHSLKVQERLTEMTSSRDAAMFTSQRRYLFFLPEFREQLMERATFRADVRVRKGYAYLDFDYADITSGPLARCAAVVQKPSQLQPPPPSSVVDFKWLCSLGPLLSKQDMQDGFCNRAVQAQSRIAPIAICRKPFAGEQSLHICLFIADNKASRKAIRLAKVLMQNDANFLRIVTVASTQSAISRAEDMMAFYRELLGVVPSNQLITEVVVRRHGTTVDTLMDYVKREPTDMIIMGTEKLSQEHSMGSVTLAVLKTTALPVLVVKSETLTECTKEEVDKLARSERRSMKLLLRVEHSSRSSLNFAMQMLDPRHDRIALVRCKGSSQLGLGQMEEKNSDKRILESYQDTANARHFSTTALNTNLDPLQALPKLASENGCDIMMLRRSTKAKLADDIPACIMKARTAVLVYQDEDGGKSPSGGVSSKSMHSTSASTKALL